MLPLLLAACGLPEGSNPEPSLDTAAIDVLSSLELARERASRGDPGASEAVLSAIRTFETSIEPSLRATRPVREVLALEVGFARIRAAIDAGRDPGPAVTDLAERLRASIEAS